MKVGQEIRVEAEIGMQLASGSVVSQILSETFTTAWAIGWGLGDYELII